MDDEIKIIENTEEAQHKYAKLGWGHGQVTLDRKHLKALMDGKAVAYFDGEYTHSIVLSQETKTTPAGTEVEELKREIQELKNLKLWIMQSDLDTLKIKTKKLEDQLANMD